MARYLGVAPWDLQKQPVIWVTMGREAQAAEAYAREERRNRSKFLDDAKQAAKQP